MLSPADIWRRLTGSEPPNYVGKYSGPLTVLGGGRCLWDDVAKVGTQQPRRGMILPGDTLACNDAGMHWHGPLHHWVTLHPEYMPGWIKFRMGHLYGEDKRPITYSHIGGPEIDRLWPQASIAGSSGLMACLGGLMLGYAPILLCGVPMDGSGHFFDPPWVEHHDFLQDHMRMAWTEYRRDFFGERVKSMSGRSRDWLGGPADWGTGADNPFKKAAAA